MAFNIDIEFRGLCLFHLGYPNDDQVAVLLVRADKEHPLCSGSDQVHRHHAWLRLDDRPDIPLSSGYTLKIGPQDGKVDMMHRKVPRNAVPGGQWGSDEEIQWIAPLQTVLQDEPNAPTLDSTCHQGPLPNDRVVARVLLREGRLQCRRIGRSGGVPINWNFQDSPPAGPSRWNQALTDQVTLSIQNVNGTYPIELQEHGQPPKTLNLSASDGGRLVVGIENEPPPNTYRGPVLRHFLWFYDLLDTCPQEMPIPASHQDPDSVVDPARDETEEGVVTWLVAGNAFCPPASWDDS